MGLYCLVSGCALCQPSGRADTSAPRLRCSVTWAITVSTSPGYSGGWGRPPALDSADHPASSHPTQPRPFLKFDQQAAQTKWCGLCQGATSGLILLPARSVPCSADPKRVGSSSGADQPAAGGCGGDVRRRRGSWLGLWFAGHSPVSGVYCPCDSKSSRTRSIWCMRSCSTVTIPMSPLPSRFQ